MDNIFGNPYTGLLGQDEEKISQNANMRGLLGLAGALLEAGGRSRQPTSLGQAFGKGVQAYQQGQGDVYNQAVQNIMLKQKMADATKPKLMTLKDESGAERIVSFDPVTKAFSTPNIPNMQGTGSGLYKFADQTFNQAAQILYPGLRASDIQADPTKMAAVEKKALGIKSEPGVAAERVKLRDPLRIADKSFEVVTAQNKLFEPDQDAVNKYGVLNSNVYNPTPVGDTAIIYSFAKILNPGEAIMEGDIKNILANRSISTSLKQSIEKAVVSGTNLSPQERLEIQSLGYRTLRDRAKVAERKLNIAKNQIEKIGGDPSALQGVNPYANLEKPKQLVVTVAGKKMTADLAKDGEYYFQSGGKYYKVQE